MLRSRILSLDLNSVHGGGASVYCAVHGTATLTMVAMGLAAIQGGCSVYWSVWKSCQSLGLFVMILESFLDGSFGVARLIILAAALSSVILGLQHFRWQSTIATEYWDLKLPSRPLLRYLCHICILCCIFLFYFFKSVFIPMFSHVDLVPCIFSAARIP